MMPSYDSLVAIAAVLTFFGLFAPLLPRERTWARSVIVSATVALTVHYLTWRIPVTVLPADALSVQSVWIWAVFGLEALAWFDCAIFLIVLVRLSNRSPEADRHEVRLRAIDPAALPTVDVFIPTYNEPFEILEKTITGARFLDWPPDKLNIWVLDDGRRDWLERFCTRKGVGYLTRPDNTHAKAGNLNAALQQTSGEFFAIFDADFVPRRQFLYRMMGFFEDPKVGIVQAPHHFFNHDSIQSNLGLRRILPDDQRLFFDRIMTGRDSWDCAFCCGSNSITRRRAIEENGGALPTESITEDMLLTLTLLRKGYVTRYLSEKLASGLAAESLDAFSVQRKRWAQGSLQILYLRNGPLGPSLPLLKRLIFLPTYWVVNPLMQILIVLFPPIFLLTGLPPLAHANLDGIYEYQIPALIALLATLRYLAPGQFFFVPSQVLHLIQSYRILPTVLSTLVNPSGQRFKVTPKGKAARRSSYSKTPIWLSLAVLLATAVGLFINSQPHLRIVEADALFVVAPWSLYTSCMLILVMIASTPAPAGREEERFPLDEGTRLRARSDRGLSLIPARFVDLSLSGARVKVDPDNLPALGETLSLDIQEVGRVRAEVVRREGCCLGLRFDLPPSPERECLIRKLFTGGLDNATSNENGLLVTFSVLGRVFAPDHTEPAPSAANG
jgi:cellulose synthase (UDP-forming)